MTVQLLMTEEELKQWILRRLGAPLVKVEITADHLQDAVEQAKRWFAAKKGMIKLQLMPLQNGMGEYELPDDCDTVIDVTFHDMNADLNLIFSPYLLVDEKIPYDVFAAPNSMGIYSTFAQTLQFMGMAKRVLSSDQDWFQQGHKLIVTPLPRSGKCILIEFKSHAFTIEKLIERDHDMLKRYALAQAKHDLGIIRRKYKSYQAVGGQGEWDGAELLTESTEEIEKLNEEIIQSGYPMPFQRG